MTPLATIARFRDKPPEFAPGERFKYSSSGYLLLGYIVERTSGERYEDFLRKNIYEPLGMSDSGYDHPRTILKDRASGYLREKGELVNAMFMRMDTPLGGGSMYSTVGDLLRWDQALYTDKLISRKSLAQIFTPFQGHYPVAPRNRRFGYGYGWFILKSFGHDLITHSGNIPGFCSVIMRYPEDRTLVIVLENMEAQGGGDPDLVEPYATANGLSAIAFGLPPNTDPISVTLHDQEPPRRPLALQSPPPL
jgi:CubicO group peptidase (beta-lactamase class C family)